MRRRSGHHDGDSTARFDPVKAFRFAPTPFGAHGLDRLSVEPTEGSYVMAGRHEGRSRKERTMRDISPTPNITVTIGGQLRIYYAYVTTAGPELDGPSTMTLYASTLTDLSGFAADPIVHERVGGKARARLVLIDLKALSWHRAGYRWGPCVL